MTPIRCVYVHWCLGTVTSCLHLCAHVTFAYYIVCEYVRTYCTRVCDLAYVCLSMCATMTKVEYVYRLRCLSRDHTPWLLASLQVGLAQYFFTFIALGFIALFLIDSLYLAAYGTHLPVVAQLLSWIAQTSRP